MKIILSLEDKIEENSVWCGTFNLIWNDLKNNLVKQDIVFKQQTEIIKNLNKGTFNKNELEESSYYKNYGRPTIKLKEEIEKAIKEKFNETSEILDNFNWSNENNKDYFLYSMLKKKFEFPKVFTELEKGKFGNIENVKYFGINNLTSKEVKEQVEVLYYNFKDDFAIKLITKGNDEVILTKGNNNETFLKTFEDINKKAENFLGDVNIQEDEKVKIPNINIDLNEEIYEVENNSFEFLSGERYKIEKAVQTIKFELDKKGGEVKSEAGMMTRMMALRPDRQIREFFIDKTFVMFLKEKNKNVPYFAAKISDINQVQ